MHTYILLDRSGSMATRWTETIAAINTYIANRREASPGDALTIAVFDSDTKIQYEYLRQGEQLRAVRDIQPNETVPRGMTPLYDAIGRLASRVIEDNAERAAVVIVTDGLENASVEVSRDAARKMLDDMRQRNFDVSFIGANFDAMEQSRALGGTSGQTINTVDGYMRATMAAVSEKHGAYARTGIVSEFSAVDRSQAVGNT